MYVLVLEAMSLNRKKRTTGRATSLDSQVASHLPTQTRWHASHPMTRWRSWRTAFNLVNLGTVLTVLYLRRPNRLVECVVTFRKEPRSDCQFPNHYQLFRQHSISSLSKPLFPLNVQVWESTKATFRKWNLGRPRFGSKVREDDEVSMTLTDLERNVLIQRLATFRVAFRIGKGNGLDHDSQSLGWHAKIMVESIHPVWTNQRVTKERCGPLVT